MLIASGTISKESTHIKSNNMLRSHHRAIMASLSKLVLSAQLFDSSTSKLLSDCHELLVAVRNFTSTCENIPVELHHINPTIVSLPTSNNNNSRAKYALQTDLIENLDAYGASMQESMESLMANLTRHSDSRCSLAVLLFTQYRNFGNQNGQFLSIIEDIDFDGVIHSPFMKQLAIAKQKLYDGLGSLFFKMQIMTDESVSMDKVILEMQDAAQTIISAIQAICKHMANLVVEKNRLASQNEGEGEETMGNKSTAENVSVDPIHPTSSSSSSSAANTNSISDFLFSGNSLGNNDFLSLDLSLPNFNNSNDTSKNGKRSQSLSAESNHNSAGPTNAKNQQRPRFLKYDYSPNEIVFTLEGSVKGGTLRALVERMTLHDYLDLNFNSTFLLTYRSFCTSIEVLELLEARYNIQPPADLTPEELEIWANKKQKLVRLRVFNVLKIWLEQYYYEEDSVILDRLLHFTNTSIKQTLSFSAYQLERLIQKRKEASQGMLLKKLVNTQPHDLPEPILPRNLKKFRLLDLDPMEMARQLTLMDFKLYNSIKPVECLDKAWSRDAASSSSSSASTAPLHTHIAANIQASIDYCNQVTTWVSDEILSQSEVKKRSMLIKYWVNVAERCRVYNNFNTCMAILSAFDNSAVGRLKRTWEMVGARTNHIVAHMRKLMGANRNFNQYRALIHSVNPPCIPFLGIYLQDLTFIEDGNPNFLKTSKDLINFAKRAKTAEVIREIQQYQTMGYHFRPVEEIQTFITENLHSSRDEDQLYKESLKLEPKERDDEKITRLLQESGFL
ncbi:MAG: ras guanine nucleotide exchange factor domain-containing protein [Benjaminiella poitrasii]|nr:MAG: ras guanine nucleotide exchange factor domain-containing protein [Benjaminiella poitrasii]